MPPMAFKGLVTKAGYMNKTVTVTVSRFVVHRTTKKRVERTKKYLIHDENNVLREEDVVLIRNCPPISARKRFTLEQIIRSPVAERKVDKENATLADAVKASLFTASNPASPQSTQTPSSS